MKERRKEVVVRSTKERGAGHGTAAYGGGREGEKEERRGDDT